MNDILERLKEAKRRASIVHKMYTEADSKAIPAGMTISLHVGPLDDDHHPDFEGELSLLHDTKEILRLIMVGCCNSVEFYRKQAIEYVKQLQEEINKS